MDEKRLLPTLALLLVAVVAALGWRSSTGRAEDRLQAAGAPGPSSDAESEVAPTEGSTLMTPAALDSASERTAAGAAPVPATPATPATARDGERATILVRFVSAETHAPVAGQRCSVRERSQISWSGRFVGAAEGGLGEVPVSGADGIVRLHVPPGSYSVRAESGGDELQFVGDLAAGETRELVIAVTTRTVEGCVLVLDAETRFPLPDVGLRLRDLPRGMTGAASVTRTDDRGLARFLLPPERTVHGSADAEGYGPADFALGRDHQTPATALVLLLQRASTLRGVVIDGAGRPLTKAWVRVTARWRDTQTVRTLAEAFQARDETWSEPTDLRGEFEITGLTSGVRLEVEVKLDGRAVPQDNVHLQPGEVRVVTYRILPGTLLTGVLLDADGAPCPAAQMWLVAGDIPRMLEAGEERRAATHTGADGSFRFEDVPSGTWLVGPAFGSALVPRATRVDVPGGAPRVDVVVRLPAALFVVGRTLGPNGEPVPGVGLFAFGEAGTANGQSNADGLFRLGPLGAGRVSVLASSVPDGHASGPPAEAIAGAEDVVVRLETGGSLVVRVRDGLGQPVRGEAWVSSMQDGAGSTHMSTIDAKGICRFENLAPGLYSIRATAYNGQVGTLEEVRVDSEGEGEVLVEVR